MKEAKRLLHHVQMFFQDYLRVQRGVSSQTIYAYRDALKLFLEFLVKHKNRHVTKLSPDDLSAEAVLAFLVHLEEVRHNKTVTRNLRLSAIRTFFRYLASQDTLRSGQHQRVVSLPFKQTSRGTMPYLEILEVQTILNLIGQDSPTGRRDYVLLNVLYNTGARVQEVCDLRVEDVHFETPPVVVLTGKRRKTRIVPLWQETATLLKSYLEERGIAEKAGEIIFVSARGVPLTRFGVRHIIQTRVSAAKGHCPGLIHKKVGPHTFRHTTAMHLLQSGVDLTVIKNWLGHVNLETTHAYVEIDLAMKQKALSAYPPASDAQRLHRIIKQNDDIISWLDAL
jgi:integrase/recombinase XerD